MFDELSQDIKRAAGPTDTPAAFDPIWLRANQMQRRRAAFFSLAAASVSIVAVMGVGAIRSAEPLPGTPAALPVESFDTQMVTVPDVVGMPVRQATEVLSDEGLEVEDDRTINCNPYTVHAIGKKGHNKNATIQIEVKGKDRRKAHTVFCSVSGLVKRQTPVAGSEVAEGSVVDLMLDSRGRSRVRIWFDLQEKLDDLQEKLDG